MSDRSRSQNWLSLRIEKKAMRSVDLSSVSGGIDGRPDSL